MTKLTLDNDRQVFFYEQDFYVLSNFSAFRVSLRCRKGILHPKEEVCHRVSFDTCEHAYHYFKFPGEPGRHIRRMILHASSAHEAFTLAQEYRHKRRPDWDRVKVGIMKEILLAKVAQHEYVRRKLLETGDRELVENSWRDGFWGWGENRKGVNALGKLWMDIRDDLLSEGVTNAG